MARRAGPSSTFITLRQAEQELGIGYFLLYRAIEKGLLKRVDRSLAGNRFLVRRQDVLDLVNNNME